MTQAAWTHLNLVESPQRTENAIDLTTFQAKRDVELAPDHVSFLEELGEGVIYNHVRVWGLDFIRKQLHGHRQRCAEYWLWDHPDSALSEDDVAAWVPIADSFSGDEFVVCPGRGGTIFLLPSDDHVIRVMGDTLRGAMETYVAELRAEVATYDEEEQDEWDLSPSFAVSSF